MVTACIFLEGGASGAHSKELTTRCQQAFHKLLDRMGFTGRKPRLVAGGGRGAVFERFCTALTAGTCDYLAMWIDSEEPMSNIEDAWKHLANVTTVPTWEKPDGATNEQVLFMTTCMETWILADWKTLREHYGHELQENTLLSLNELEQRTRGDVQEKLTRATRNCRNTYAKGKQSYMILGKLDPETLLKHLHSFVRVQRILVKRL